MIQRIQSLYLLVSTILGVVCLSLPLGYFYSNEGVMWGTLYNLWISVSDKGLHIFTPWALFALLVIVTTLTFLDIFLYKHRALQMRILSLSMLLLVGYYAWFGFMVYMENQAGALSFKPSITAAFPFISIVLDYLAFRGILKDELLVRSLDRLR